MESVLRWLYQPYKWLILGPVIVLSTLVLGAVATAGGAMGYPKLASRAVATTWARIIGGLTPIFVSVRGWAHAEKGQSYIIVSNHQSQYDIIVLYGWLGMDIKWVMKQELRKVPVLGLACEKLGHIYIDRSDRSAAIASLNRAKATITDGTSVIFFPEGTRSRTGELKPFKKGAFRMALDLGVPILPLSIVGSREVLPAGSVDLFPGKIELVIHEPVAVTGFSEESLEALMATVRARIARPLNRASRAERQKSVSTVAQEGR